MGEQSFGTCGDCKTATAVIKFTDEPSAVSHGGTKYICRLCYIKKIEQDILDLKKNLEIQKELAGVK